MSDCDSGTTVVDADVTTSPASRGTTTIEELRRLADRLEVFGLNADAENLRRLMGEIEAPRRELDLIATNTQRALDACDGHVVRAARLIGLATKTLYLRLNGESRPGLGLRRPTRSVR